MFYQKSGFFILSILLFFGCSQNDDKGRAYVSNQKAKISVIDLNNFEVVNEIDSYGGSPRGIGVSEDGKYLIVANGDDGNIAIIDRISGELSKKVDIGENPEFVRVKDNLAFVSYEPASIGGPPPKPGSQAEKELREKREEEDEQPAQVAVVDIEKGEVIKSIVGGMETEGIEFSSDGSKILVTNEADDNVSVHDIESGELYKTISTIEYGYRPRGIKMSPDGSYYVASIEYGDSLVILDSNFEVVQSVKTGRVPYGIAFSDDGEKLFVALNKDSALEVFDTKTWESIKKIPTGKRCWHFSYTPDRNSMLVACGKSDNIIIIDPNNLEKVSEIPSKGMPWGIVTFPKATGSLD